MDAGHFWDLLIAAIHAADKQSPLNETADGGSGCKAAP
jgi:hypothetical protein